MKVMNFINSIKLSTITYLLTSLMGLVLYMQIFSLFDINTVGKFSIYQTICFFGSKLISLSTPYSLMRYVSENNNSKINLNYLFSALLINFILFLILYSLLSFNKFLELVEEIPYIEIIVLLSVTVFLQSANYLFKTFFNAYKDFIFYNISFLSRTLIFITTIYLLYKEILTQFYLVFFYTEAILCIINLLLLVIRVKYYNISNLSESFLKHFKFMRSSFLTSVFSEIVFKIDIYCVAILLGEYYAGVFALIVVIGEGLVGLIYVLRNNLTPYITLKNFREKDLETKKYIVATFKLSNLIAFVTSFIVIFVIVIGSKKLDILNLLFEEGLTTLIIFLIGFSLLSFLLSIENMLLQLESHGLHTAGLVFLNFINIFLNFSLSNFQLVGIAFGTIFSYFLFAIYILNVFRRRFKYSILSYIFNYSNS